MNRRVLSDVLLLLILVLQTASAVTNSTVSPSPIAHPVNCTTTYERCLQLGNGNCQRVSCPSNCTQSVDDVFGWQIYSGESSICIAAVQAGISNKTDIHLLRRGGRKFYSSANQNGILSKSQGPSNVSFTFPFLENFSCGLGWVLQDDSCYLIIANSSTSYLSWNEANTECSSHSGGHLLTIDDGDEQIFIQSQLSKGAGQGVWIGLNDKEENGNFVWSDGLPVDYTQWASGQPSNKHHCVLVNQRDKGYWITAECNSSAGYICEKANESPTPTKYPYERGDCPLGWVHLESSCYWWQNKSSCNESVCSLSWSDAVKSCHDQNQGANLISLNSDEEWGTAKNFISESGWAKVWIGLDDRKKQGDYVWSDGSHVSEGGFRWAKGQPDDKSHTQNCVAMHKYGTMYDESCSKTMLPFICEIQPHSSKASGGGLSSGVIAVIVIAIMLLVVVVVLVIRKRIKGGGQRQGYTNVKTGEKGEGNKMVMKTHQSYGAGN